MRKLREWCARYLPAEITGTACAVVGAYLAYRVSGDRKVAAITATAAENAGFYAVMASREWLRQRRSAGGGVLGAAGRTLRVLVAEFGPAEVLDSVLLRPLSMYAGPFATGGIASGALVGKLLADAAFYGVAIASYEIARHRARRRLDHAASAIPVPSTPILVMDLDAVTAAHRDMVAALPGVALHYAMKCNPARAVLAALHDSGCGFEIASAAELDDLLAIGVDPGDVLYSNPVKPADHVARAYAAGVRVFAFDSAAEVPKLATAAPGSAVVVRLAADDMHSDVPSEGKFGVDAQTAAALLLDAREWGLHPHGIAFHVGSQMLRPQAWRAPLRSVGEIMAKLATDGVRLDLVNVGGGFPARYHSRPPPLAEYGAVIAAGLTALPYPVRAVAEPGRALVAEAGTLVATVIGTALRSGRRWVHVDVGAFNGLMEALETGNRLRFPVCDSRGAPPPHRERCHLTGPTCDSQDTILFDVDLSAGLEAGDLVYIGCTGAYTTAYASTFNGFQVPVVRCGRGPHAGSG